MGNRYGTDDRDDVTYESRRADETEGIDDDGTSRLQRIMDVVGDGDGDDGGECRPRRRQPPAS